jgi:molybdenum cofactor biosynthesis enzyme MoaA
LHKDIIKIIEEIIARGKKVHIATNATYIPKDFFHINPEALKVQVSLPGNKATYHHVTGRDLYDKVIQNLAVLKKSLCGPNKEGTERLTVNYVVYKDNLSSANDIFQVALELDVPLSVSLVYPIRKGKNVKLLDQEEISALSRDILRASLSGLRVVSSIFPKEPTFSQFTTPCPILADVYGFNLQGNCPEKTYVSPTGDISRCEFGDYNA